MRHRLIDTHRLTVVGRLSSTQAGAGGAWAGVLGGGRGLEPSRAGG